MSPEELAKYNDIVRRERERRHADEVQEIRKQIGQLQIAVNRLKRKIIEITGVDVE